MNPIERHVTSNAPGDGWYWEVISEFTIARGLAHTREEAETQATEAEQTAFDRGVRRRSS